MVASGDVKEPSAKIIMHVFEAASNGGDYLPYRYHLASVNKILTLILKTLSLLDPLESLLSYSRKEPFRGSAF